MSYNRTGYYGNMSKVYSSSASSSGPDSSVQKRKLPSEPLPAKKFNNGTSASEISPEMHNSSFPRVQPFSIAKAPQIYGAYDSIPSYRSAKAEDSTPKWIAKAKKAPDYNVLVVPNPEDPTAQQSSAVPINIRKPSTISSEQSTSIGPQILTPTIPKYNSTVSNRLGLSSSFDTLTPKNKAAHNEGIGQYLLKKMGWAPGEGIGIREQPATSIIPLAEQVDLKLDKKGLGVQETATKPKADLSQLVGMMNNMCWERHWRMPVYELLDESGPPHMKKFRYKVTFNGMEYLADEAGASKKVGKALAAKALMEALELI